MQDMTIYNNNSMILKQSKKCFLLDREQPVIKETLEKKKKRCQFRLRGCECARLWLHVYIEGFAQQMELTWPT